MSSSVRSRLFGRVVIDHHDVLFLLRHHHLPITDLHDVLVVFVLDDHSRLSHTFISADFPRMQLSAVEELNEHLATLINVSHAASVVVCWCTSSFITLEVAEEQLQLLAGLRLGVAFAGLRFHDLYWVNPDGFVSLADRATKFDT
jgi:hypothetical protein